MITSGKTRKRVRNGQDRKPIYGGVAGGIARVFDAALSIVAPRLVHSMRVSRMKSAGLIAYEAAEITRTNPKTQSGSADGEILPSLDRLRELSRTMIRDDAHAASTINILEESIVGEGVTPQSVCTPAATGMSPEECQAWREACEAEWKRWAEHEADATKVGTFYDLQTLALRCWLQDGDAIGHAVIGGDGLISCELIDADRVQSPGLNDTETIRAGVELGPHGERIAFHVLPKHPDDWFVGSKNSTTPVPIPFEDNDISIVQHVFKRTRPGQTRGVPIFTPSLLYTRHLHHYLDSELIAARAASNFALFIKRGVSSQDTDIFPVQNNEQATGQEFHEELQPGIIEYLNEGEEPFEFAPNRPGTAFDGFVTRLLRAIAASTGLSYEIVARDFGRMNLSSARAMLRECRRGFDLMRRRLVRGFCQPWWNNVIRMAVGAGRLRPPKQWLDNPAAFLACEWISPGYGMVDPETDVKASVASVAANLSTQKNEGAKHGRDAEQDARERARFMKFLHELEKEHGLDRGALSAQPNAPSKPAQEKPAEPEREPEPEPEEQAA